MLNINETIEQRNQVMSIIQSQIDANVAAIQSLQTKWFQ